MRYTSLLEPMPFPLIRRCCAAALVLLLAALCAAQTAAESAWTKPARDLVRESLEKAASPATVSFDVENHAGIAPAELAQIRRAFDEQLRAAKVKVVRNESAVAEIKFILSRDPRGLLWIAQVKQGPSNQISMLEFPDPSRAGYVNKPALFVLRKKLLLARGGIILDVAVLEDELIVLGSDQISLYRRNSLIGTASAAVAILHSNRWPRDLRGRLFVSGDGFTAYLPGVHCSGSLHPGFAAHCSRSDDPWPLVREGAGEPAAFFGGARNHFSGALGGSLAGFTVPPFFTAARLGDSPDAMWVFSGSDGNTRFYAPRGQPLRTATSLGSDLAALQSNCGAGPQLLVTGDGDATAADTLQAFEVRNRDAVLVSERLDFNGPITALWTSPDHSRATVIVRDPGKEAYEAYSVSLTCR